MRIRITKEAASQAVYLVEEALKNGGKPPSTFGPGKSAIELAAERLIAVGDIKSARGLRHRLEAAEREHGLTPDWDLWKPVRYQQHPYSAPGVIVRGMAPLEPSKGVAEKVLVIPDLHQDPRHPHRLEVLKWVARFGSQQKYQRVVQLGDWLSMDSVSRHDKNDTFHGRTKPLISDDISCLKASLDAWESGRDKEWKPRLRVTKGNHEERLEIFENMHPESWGVFTDQIDRMWKSYGWQTSPYGEIIYINGVGFVHAPMGMMGKPISGKTAGPRTANELTADLVHGHTHRFSTTRVAKIGTKDSVMVMEAGCALPWGEVEHYARHSMTGWWWGVVEITICDGEITDWSAISMKTLRSEFSDDGADVRSVA